MKKVIAILMALLMVLSLAGCGNGSTIAKTSIPTEAENTPTGRADSPTAPAEPDAAENSSEPIPADTEELAIPEPIEEPTEDDTVYQVGDTASGELFDFTLKAVSFVEKVENGRVTHNTNGDKYYDAVPSDGYSIVKIIFTVDYNGKRSLKLNLKGALNLDYDEGYEFYPVSWNESMPTTQDMYSGYYCFNETADFEIDISDPLSFTKQVRALYFFVNKEVETNADAPLLLKVRLSSQDTSEQYVFNARSTTSEEEIYEELYQEARALVDEGTEESISEAVGYLEAIGYY